MTIADTTNFAVNDYILLRTTKAWIGGQGKQGEIRQVRSKTSTVLTLDGPVQDAYSTVDTANIIKLNMVENVTLEGFSMKPASSSWVQTGSFLNGMFCRNLVYRNICVYNMYGSNTNCCMIRSCIESKMDHCQAILEEGFPITGNHAYGFKFSQANRNCTMESCNMIGPWRHLVASEGSDAANCEGVCRGITILNCYLTGIKDSGFDTHENGEDIQFIGCTVEGGEEHGFNVRSPGVQIKGCTVVGVDDYGIYLFGDAKDALLIGNKIRRCSPGIRLGPDVQRVTIDGNVIQDCSGQGIHMANNVTDITISNNEFNNISGANAAIYDISSVGSPTNRVSVFGNRILNCQRAVRMTNDSTGWKIYDNTCENNNTTSQLTGSNKIFGNSGDATLADNLGGAGGGGDISGGSNVGSGTGLVFKDEAAGVLNFRSLLAGTNVTLTNNANDITIAASGGGGAILPTLAYWRMWIDTTDGNKVKATNGITTFSHASDAGNVLSSIFNSVGNTVPFTIEVDPGNYKIESWGSGFGHSNFSIIGSGIGVTNFVITDTLTDTTGMFAFMGPSTDTACNFAADAPMDTWAVMTNSITNLTDGAHVLLSSSAILPLAVAEMGEHNRIVKIVATGSTPAYRIILEKSTRFDYLQSDTANIKRKAFLENIHLKGFSLIADQSIATYTGQKPFMRLDYVYNSHFEDLHFKDWGNWAGGFHHCLVENMVVNSLFENCVFENSPERGHAPAGDPQNPNGYAISCRAGCETLYHVNCRFYGLIRHCFTTTSNNEGDKVGHPMNIWLINCNAETTTEAAFESHGEGDGLNYINCSMHSSRSAGSTDTTQGTEDTDAFSNRCNRVRYINCTVENCRGTPFSLGDGTVGHQIFNCKAKNIHLGRNAFQIGADDVIMSNCSADDVDGRGLIIDSGATNVVVNGFRCKNVNVSNPTQAAVKVEGAAKNVVLSNMVLDVTNNPTANPIASSSDCEGITYSNITVVGSTTGKADLQGIDIKLDHQTCKGAGLGKALRKTGTHWFQGSQNASGMLNGILTGAGGSKRVETTDGLFFEFATSTLNTVQGVKCSNITERDLNPYARFAFRIEQTTGMRVFLMFSSSDTAVGPAGADPLLNVHGIGLKLDSGGSNFVIYSNGGTATTTTGANIAAVDTNKHEFEIRAINSATKFQWRWDFGTWNDVTTNIPSATNDMCIQAYMENNETGVNKTLNLMEIEVSHDNK